MIPTNLKDIDYLFTHHMIWKKTIKKYDYIEIKINNIIYISKIIHRQDNDIIVYTNNDFFFKIQLLSPKIKNYVEFNSINIIIPYDTLDFLNILIIESMFEKMILEKQYSLTELVELLI